MGYPQRKHRVSININGKTATIERGHTANDVLREIGETQKQNAGIRNQDGTYQQIPGGRRIKRDRGHGSVPSSTRQEGKREPRSRKKL